MSMPQRTPPLGSEVTLEDVARAVTGVEETLSEVLVLLYHVIHAHQDLVDSLRASREAAAKPPVSA